MGTSHRPLRRDVCQGDLSERGTPSNRDRKITVNKLKHIGLTLVQLAKQVGTLPQALENLVKQRQLRTVLNEREAERLDRIRNPSKYRGK